MTLARVHAVQAFIRSASGSSMSLLRIKLTCIADLLPKLFLRPSAFYTAENVSIKKNHNQLLRFVLFKFVWNCDCDFEIFIFWCVQNSCFYHVTDFSDVCFCFSHISAFFLYLCVNIECTFSNDELWMYTVFEWKRTHVFKIFASVVLFSCGSLEIKLSGIEFTPPTLGFTSQQ